MNWKIVTANIVPIASDTANVMKSPYHLLSSMKCRSRLTLLAATKTVAPTRLRHQITPSVWLSCRKISILFYKQTNFSNYYDLKATACPQFVSIYHLKICLKFVGCLWISRKCIEVMLNKSPGSFVSIAVLTFINDLSLEPRRIRLFI